MFLGINTLSSVEHKLEHQFTCPQILKTLREFNFNHHYVLGYVPTFSRNYTSLYIYVKKDKKCFLFKKNFFLRSSGGIKRTFLNSKQQKIQLKLDFLFRKIRDLGSNFSHETRTARLLASLLFKKSSFIP